MLTRPARLAIFVAAAAMIVAAVCIAGRAFSRHYGSAPSDFQTVRLVDMTGRTVALPVRPQRMLSLCTSATDTLYRIGKADLVRAIDEYNAIFEAPVTAEVIGKGSMISREKIIELKIDLAFIWWYQDDAAATLESLGVPVVRIASPRVEDIPAMIKLVATCVGDESSASPPADKIASFLAECRSKSCTNQSRPKVFIEMYSPFKTIGNGSYINELLELAGAENIAASAGATPMLSVEKLIQSQPDIIFCIDGIATPQAITSRPGMDQVRAAAGGRIFKLNRRLLVAGAGLPDAVEQIRRIIGQNRSHERK